MVNAFRWMIFVIGLAVVIGSIMVTSAQEPLLTIESPYDGEKVDFDTITVSGYARGTGGAVVDLVTVNGVSATGTSLWSAEASLQPGPNPITVIAKDEMGEVCSETITVYYQAPITPPTQPPRYDGAPSAIPTPTPTPTVSISITSIPSGAKVRLDDSYKGTTPIRENVTVGYHKIEVTKEGYEIYSETKRIRLGGGEPQEMIIELKPLKGSIAVFSTPSGASVYLDNVYKGDTNCMLSEVAVGPHSIKLTKSGYDDVISNVSVSAGRTFQLHENLTPSTRYGYINISSDPPGAKVYLDDDYTNDTPCMLSGVVVGPHTINLTKFGYDDEIRNISVSVGETLYVNENLTGYGSLRISSYPSGAKVYLDGNYTGETPLDIEEVVVGSYSIKLTKFGYASMEKKIDVSAGKREPIDETLSVSAWLILIAMLSAIALEEAAIGFIRKRIIPFIRSKKRIETLKKRELKNKLDSLDIKGFETEVEAIRSKLKSPDKIPEIEKGIEELMKIAEKVPDLSVDRSTSEISIMAGDELDVTIELKNDGNDVAKSVSLSDRFPDGFKIISGDNFWSGEIKQGESKSIEYKIKVDKAGKYTIPRLTVKYEDKQGKIYKKSVEAIEIEVVPEVAQAPKKNAYGVVIGINKYKDKSIPPLRYAREDACEIYNILTNPKYGDIPEDNVKLLLDEQATIGEIKAAMGTDLAQKAAEDDLVCVYFAGHGSLELDPTEMADDKMNQFFVPYDAKKEDLFSYGLSMDDIGKIFHRIKSKRVVFFIDSCYSGAAGGRSISRSDIVARDVKISETFLEKLSGEGRIIITASKPDELSLETDELKHGIFTYYLAEGLKGKANLNEDGFVTVEELYRYMYRQVEEKARQLGGTQHPVKKGTIVGDILLTQCETEEIKRINELNSEAHRLFDEGEYEAADEKWNEVLKFDSSNAEALAGISESQKKIEEMKEVLRERQKRLLELHRSQGLPTKEYDEAMILLKKNPKAYTDIEREIVGYIGKLLKGEIRIDTYVETLKLIKED